MPARGDEAQHFLFGDDPISRARMVIDAAAVPEETRRLAAQVPPRVHLGTSSWSFPGWRGLIYASEAPATRLARHGLAAYAAHPLLRTVGLDRAFYQPLSREEYRELAALVPPGFRFLVKAHQAVTRPFADESGHTFGDTAALAQSGAPNPLFLDAEYALDKVIGPAVMGLGAACGPIVLQFPPLDLLNAKPLGGAARFLDRLAEFLSKLPRPERLGGAFIAVEVRNRTLLGPRSVAQYAAALVGAGAAHGYVWHPTMPPVGEQAAALEAAGAPATVFPGVCVRWLLRHDQGYESARERYSPYTQLVDEDPAARGQIAELVVRGIRGGRDTWVIANNKAEGSAPRTLERLAAEVVARG